MAVFGLVTKASVWALAAGVVVASVTPVAAYKVGADGGLICKAGTVQAFVGESVGGVDPSGYLVFDVGGLGEILAFDPRTKRVAWYYNHGNGPNALGVSSFRSSGAARAVAAIGMC